VPPRATDRRLLDFKLHIRQQRHYLQWRRLVDGLRDPNAKVQVCNLGYTRRLMARDCLDPTIGDPPNNREPKSHPLPTPLLRTDNLAWNAWVRQRAEAGNRMLWGKLRRQHNEMDNLATTMLLWLRVPAL